MSKLSPVSYKQLAAVFEADDFQCVRTEGDHMVFAKAGIAVAQIVPVRKRKFTFGFLKGQVPPVSDALLFAMNEEEAVRFVDGAG